MLCRKAVRPFPASEAGGFNPPLREYGGTSAAGLDGLDRYSGPAWGKLPAANRLVPELAARLPIR